MILQPYSLQKYVPYKKIALCALLVTYLLINVSSINRENLQIFWLTWQYKQNINETIYYALTRMMYCIQLSLIDLHNREKKTRDSVRVCYFGERISKLSRTDNSKTGKTGMRGIEPTIYYLEDRNKYIFYGPCSQLIWNSSFDRPAWNLPLSIMTKADTADQNSTENVVSLVHIPYLRDMLQYSLAVLILGLRPFQIGSFLAMDVAFRRSPNVYGLCLWVPRS